MSELLTQAFQPVGSSHAGFSSSAIGAGATSYALEATGTREWSLPSSRSIRLAGNPTNAPFHYKLGSSTVSVGSTNGTLVVNGGPEYVSIGHPALQSYIAVVSSTTVVVNITLGHGKG